jgi:deoxyribonuclease-1
MTRLALASLLLLVACGDKTTDDTAPTDDTGGSGSGGDGEDPDGDGYTDDDCDPDDPDVHPGAVERCNGLDDDCDGAVHPGEVDADGDAALDCAACGAAGLWPPAADVSDRAGLDAAFAARFAADACPDYGDARTALFSSIDNEGGVVVDIYTGAEFDLGGQTPDWDVVNTEHAWPRSDGADVEPRECDLHHLFVADAAVNTRRGSYPFGTVVSVDWSDGGSSFGEDAAGQAVFEPRDAVKGDIARAILYFAWRYADDVDIDTQEGAARRALLQSWHAADPPTVEEQDRSLRIADIQGEANPFVVCPELVEAL